MSEVKKPVDGHPRKKKKRPPGSKQGSRPKNQVVKPEKTSEPGLFDKIKAFFSSLFGGKKPATPEEEAPLPINEEVIASEAEEDFGFGTENEDEILSKTGENEDELDESDKTREGSGDGKSLADKFKKDVKKPKTLDDIKREAMEKAEAQQGKKFTESDAVKSEHNLNEKGFLEGHNIKNKIEAATKDKLFIIRGKDQGCPAWHYILVPHDNIKKLHSQATGETIDITKFGKVVMKPDGTPCSGWGEDPPEELKKWVEKEYG